MDVMILRGSDDHYFSKPGLISRIPMGSPAGGHSHGRIWRTRKQVNRIYPYRRRKENMKEEQTSKDFWRNTKE